MSYETCPLLDELSWVQHGFFNRHTPAPSGTGIQYFSGEFKRVMFIPQTHSDVSIALMENPPQGGADACYSGHNDRGVAMAVRTADCCPVLLACTKTKTVAAIHAGWPGALNQIVNKTIHKLMLNGAEPNRMIVALGPCLHQETFPVREDVYNQFAAAQPEIMSNFAPFEDHWKLDLLGIITHQLKYMGVFHIWQSQYNTFTSPDYYSWRNRANDPDSVTGRNVSIIGKVEE